MMIVMMILITIMMTTMTMTMTYEDTWRVCACTVHGIDAPNRSDLRPDGVGWRILCGFRCAIQYPGSRLKKHNIAEHVFPKEPIGVSAPKDMRMDITAPYKNKKTSHLWHIFTSIEMLFRAVWTGATKQFSLPIWRSCSFGHLRESANIVPCPGLSVPRSPRPTAAEKRESDWKMGSPA